MLSRSSRSAPGGEGLLDLVEAVHLDGDAGESRRSAGGDRRGDPACSGDVIVLDHRLVE
jgi:hypothetical protein